MKKEYTNGEILIDWEPDKCIHAGICVKTLPNVYDPKARPWVKPENASTEELVKQIDNCPSGALTYRSTNSSSMSETTNNGNETVVDVIENGPLIIEGKLKINDKGKVEEPNSTKTALCRCGASNNKPFCDGSHTKVNFKG